MGRAEGRRGWGRVLDGVALQLLQLVDHEHELRGKAALGAERPLAG